MGGGVTGKGCGGCAVCGWEAVPHNTRGGAWGYNNPIYGNPGQRRWAFARGTWTTYQYSEGRYGRRASRRRRAPAGEDRENKERRERERLWAVCCTVGPCRRPARGLVRVGTALTAAASRVSMEGGRRVDRGAGPVDGYVPVMGRRGCGFRSGLRPKEKQGRLPEEGERPTTIQDERRGGDKALRYVLCCRCAPAASGGPRAARHLLARRCDALTGAALRVEWREGEGGPGYRPNRWVCASGGAA